MMPTGPGNDQPLDNMVLESMLRNSIEALVHINELSVAPRLYCFRSYMRLEHRFNAKGAVIRPWHPAGHWRPREGGPGEHPGANITRQDLVHTASYSLVHKQTAPDSRVQASDRSDLLRGTKAGHVTGEYTLYVCDGQP